MNDYPLIENVYPLIEPPSATEYAPYYKEYIASVPSRDLIGYFLSQIDSVSTIAIDLDEEKLLYRYSHGKWSIKDIFCHLIDTERIFCYRALCSARGDTKEIPGFEENDYASIAKADDRHITGILTEYAAVRQATIELFKSFNDDDLLRIGVANKNKLSVRAAGYIIAGHELHHLAVIKERYLG